MSKGDLISIVTRTHTADVVARQNGRRVEVESVKDLGLGWIVAREVTRGGTVVSEHRFVATEVVSILIDKRDNDG